MPKHFCPLTLRYVLFFAATGMLVGGICLVGGATLAVAQDGHAQGRQIPGGVTQISTLLYDGALNTGTPETQGFVFFSLPLSGNLATQIFTDSLTVLDTTAQVSDNAGYFAKPGLYLPLDRLDGYSVRFRAQVITETHISQDRAGFSLLVTSNNKRGIELGFWADEVWAQEGAFTHAEGAALATATGLTDYELIVFSDTYTLTANSVLVLSGLLRDYSAAPPPPLPLNPYDTPNLVFLGDDTSGAKARIKLAYAAVSNRLPFSIYLPVILKT